MQLELTYLIARMKECAIMTSPWQLRVTSALSLLILSSANWAIMSEKLMLSYGSEIVCAIPITHAI